MRLCPQSLPRSSEVTYFNAIFERYHRREWLFADPLELVHEFPNQDDREIAALLGALLAYGSVKQIQGALRQLFALMGKKPAAFVRAHGLGAMLRALEGFGHRFTEAQDVATLLWLVGETQREFGGLEKAFLTYDNGEDYATALEGLLNHWQRRLEAERRLRDIAGKPSFKHFLSRPSRGSACKRWFLFLRWVVRPADGIDLGLWSSACPAKLLYPVDRHVLRIARNLQIVRSSQATLRTARTITGWFRRYDPADPVRYDFALCHLGILRACPSTPDVSACRCCELAPICKLKRTLESTARKTRARVSAGPEPGCEPKRQAR